MICDFNGIWRVLQRKIEFTPEGLENTNLQRCLSKWDLTALGLGKTLGIGVYVLIGSVALKMAGPSVVVSILIAAAAATLAALCYAEFSSRFPKAGSSYTYTYATIGEFAAFFVGWIIILETTFCTATIAKGMSVYIDTLANNSMSSWFHTTMPIDSAYLSTYFDLFAFLIVLVVGVMMSIGLRESVIVNKVFVGINIVVIIFIIINGSVRADYTNWFISESVVPIGFGQGGFFPFSVWGTLRGAAVCFYGFMGIECITTAAEEVRNPRRSIPFSLLTAIAISFLLFFAIATVLTMMVPYYYLDSVMPLASSFKFIGSNWSWWIISIAALFAICSSLHSAMFPLPRILYSMSSDGLLLRCFSKVTERRKTPFIATIVPTCFISVLSGIFDLEQLMLMVCAGTLIAYSIVALSVILLRYKSTELYTTSPSFWGQFFGLGSKSPTKTSSRIVHVCLLLFVITSTVVGILAHNLNQPMIPASILHGFAIIILLIICLQPTNKEELSFKTPLVPIVPCLSIYVNIHLMVMINLSTWIRLFVWIGIGFPVYLLSVLIYKCDHKEKTLISADSSIIFPQIDTGGKQMIEIIVDTPTPRESLRMFSNNNEENNNIITEFKAKDIVPRDTSSKSSFETEDVVVHHATIEINEEGEAKIIEMLDQVLQAEEDNFKDIDYLQDYSEKTEAQRKSYSELSEAGSDASSANIVLAKYNVVAQVHREDLTKVKEEPEFSNFHDHLDDEEDVTFFINSETASRTDESGYSDTIDNHLSLENIERKFKEQENLTHNEQSVPTPPPFLNELVANPFTFKKTYSIPSKSTKENSLESLKRKTSVISIESDGSVEDTTIMFGTMRQMSFMSKLDNILQQKRQTPDNVKRSNSAGDLNDTKDLSVNTERHSMMAQLGREIKTLDIRSLKSPRNSEDEVVLRDKKVNTNPDNEQRMSKDDIKIKLESLLASGGPKLSKQMYSRSNTPTMSEEYHGSDTADDSSLKSTPISPKIEKNDTLKRQKDKFGEVLQSIRMSFNAEDKV